MFRFSRHNEDRSVNSNSRKPAAFLSRLDSIKGLMAIALIVVLISGTALAGEGDVLDSKQETNDTATETAAVIRDGAEEGLNHDRGDSSPRSSSGPESQVLSSQSEAEVNGDETDIDIEVEDENNVRTTVDEEGVTRHTYESDDGRTKINVETKNNSSSSNTNTDTSIDIDINSNTSNFDSNASNDRRRNPHPDRP